MKVIITENCVSLHENQIFSLIKNKTQELPNELANDLIKAGHAKQVKSKPKSIKKSEN